jgi:hypothetical protein
MKRMSAVVVAVSGVLGLAGTACLVGFAGSCGSGVGSSVGPALGDWVKRSTTRVVREVKEKTGIELDPADIQFNFAEPRAGEGSVKVRNCSIDVNYRGTHFTETVGPLPCDPAGVPADEGLERVRAAANQIKEKIRRLTRPAD